MNCSYRGNYVKKSLLLFKFYLVPFCSYRCTICETYHKSLKKTQNTRTTQIKLLVTFVVVTNLQQRGKFGNC